MHKWITATLLAVIAIAAWQLYRERMTLAEIRSEFERLSASYGQLPVTDPQKFTITQIETGEPYHFLWRFHLPANVNLQHMEGFAGSRSWGSTSRSSPTDALCRVHFRFQGGSVRVFTDGMGGGLMTFGDEKTTRFLEAHCEELEFESVAGVGEVVELPLDQPLPILMIRIPEELMDDLGREAGEQWRVRLSKGILYHLVYGSDSGMMKVKELGLEPPN